MFLGLSPRLRVGGGQETFDTFPRTKNMLFPPRASKKLYLDCTPWLCLHLGGLLKCQSLIFSLHLEKGFLAFLGCCFYHYKSSGVSAVKMENTSSAFIQTLLDKTPVEYQTESKPDFVCQFSCQKKSVISLKLNPV